jgi:hypothetical protein
MQLVYQTIGNDLARLAAMKPAQQQQQQQQQQHQHQQHTQPLLQPAYVPSAPLTLVQHPHTSVQPLYATPIASNTAAPYIALPLTANAVSLPVQHQQQSQHYDPHGLSLNYATQHQPQPIPASAQRTNLVPASYNPYSLPPLQPQAYLPVSPASHQTGHPYYGQPPPIKPLYPPIQYQPK